MTKASGERLQRRPTRKGVGGRRAHKLFDDPDRWIVVAALWLSDDPDEQRRFTTLQMLDYLLTPHEGIELELGNRRVGDVEWVELGIVNTTSPRRSGKNLLDRLPHAAPGGNAYRHNRLKLLRQKVDAYRRKNLDARETDFCQLCFTALDFTVSGNLRMAVLTLEMLGWTMNDRARERLAGLAKARRAFNIQP